jgi:hypothetical protein
MKARKVKGVDPAGALADNLQRIVRVRCDELHSFMPRASDPSEVQGLHDMRIAAKRLRYILEMADGCFGPYAQTAAKRAKELQDLLGEIHDCDVTLPRVEALVEQAREEDVRAAIGRAGNAEDLDPRLAADAPNADAYRGIEAMIIYLRARRALLFDHFLADWEKLGRDGFRARLEFAIGERTITPPSQGDNGGDPADALASMPDA